MFYVIVQLQAGTCSTPVSLSTFSIQKGMLDAIYESVFISFYQLSFASANYCFPRFFTTGHVYLKQDFWGI